MERQPVCRPQRGVFMFHNIFENFIFSFYWGVNLIFVIFCHLATYLLFSIMPANLRIFIFKGEKYVTYC